MTSHSSSRRSEGDLSRCVEVRTSSRLVVLGSELTASCVVRPDCPALSLGGGITNIELHLGSRLLARSSHAPVAHGDSSSITVGNSSVTVGNVRNVTAVVANFTERRAWVTCCVRTSPCQEVGGVEVQAGREDLSVTLFVCRSVCLSVCLSLCLSVCLSVCLYVCRSICLSIYLAVRLPVTLSVCLSVCICF